MHVQLVPACASLCQLVDTSGSLFALLLYEKIFHFVMDAHISGSGNVACMGEIRDT
jgi:hypothetical protein